jgi:hypothetical protein
MADDDDRPRDASSAADRGWDDGEDLAVVWTNAVAPDDISELAADIKAYRREVRTERRRRTRQRVFAHPSAAPLTMMVVALALAALVATLISLTMPTGAKRPSALPAPARPTAAAGSVGGVLPSVPLTAAGGQVVGAPTLHSTVLALVPDPCNCTPLLQSLAADAGPLALDVIAPSDSDAEVAALAGTLDHGRSQVYADNGNLLRGALGASGLTVVVLNRDGTISAAVPLVSSATTLHLHTLVANMLTTKAPSG